MKEEDKKLLNHLIREIKEIKGVIGIIQIGSSLYSENYHDIDIQVFFNKVLTPPELKKIQEKYKKNRFSIEGVYIDNWKVTRGMKLFIKSFKRARKKILYGKNPYEKKDVSITKLDVAHYIWYFYHIPEMYNTGFESSFYAPINAMLTYKNIFPENKEDILKKFIDNFPSLAKYLPKNPKRFLRDTNKSNFEELYPFFEKSMEYFLKD